MPADQHRAGALRAVLGVELANEDRFRGVDPRPIADLQRPRVREAHGHVTGLPGRAFIPQRGRTAAGSVANPRLGILVESAAAEVQGAIALAADESSTLADPAGGTAGAGPTGGGTR